MGPLQQWRASERVDNRAADPCRMLDSTTRLPSLCFLSAGPGLSSGSSTALRAYLTVPAWQRSCTPMSVPKVTKASAQLSLCGEGAGGAGERSGRMEEIIWHMAPCLRPVDLEMRRSKHDCRMISFSLPSCVSPSREKNICMSWGENEPHIQIAPITSQLTDGLVLNLVQTFIVPTGYIPTSLRILCFFL